MARRRSKKKLYLRSSDGNTIIAEKSLVAESGLLRSNLMNNTNSYSYVNIIVVLPNVDSATLSLLIDYCRTRPRPSLRLSFDLQQLLINAFEHDFITTRVHSPQTLRNLKLAAETLEIESLLDLTRTRIEELDSDSDEEEKIDANLERPHKSPHWALIIIFFLILAIFVIYMGIVS